MAVEGYKLLMVDDDVELLAHNCAFFESRGYEVVCVENAREAKAAAFAAGFDCVILDIDLPDADGYDVCTTIRESASLPIVFLSAYTEEESRIRGLSIGGDDYVCKPCSLVELELRVRLRIQSRCADHLTEPLCFGALTIDPARREIIYDGRTGDFSRIEFDILCFLARSPERVYSYEQLYDAVWREPINMGRHSIQARIAEVRKKLYLLCPQREYIRTIRHRGYQFMP